MDVCVPGGSKSDSRSYGPHLAQELAYADTNLALHNPENYALFAVDVALNIGSAEPLEFEPMRCHDVSVPEKSVKVVSSLLAEVEALSTTTLSTPTPFAGCGEAEPACDAWRHAMRKACTDDHWYGRAEDTRM